MALVTPYVVSPTGSWSWERPLLLSTLGYNPTVFCFEVPPCPCDAYGIDRSASPTNKTIWNQLQVVFCQLQVGCMFCPTLIGRTATDSAAGITGSMLLQCTTLQCTSALLRLQ